MNNAFGDVTPYFLVEINQIFWGYLPSYPENYGSLILQTGGKFLPDYME